MCGALSELIHWSSSDNNGQADIPPRGLPTLLDLHPSCYTIFLSFFYFHHTFFGRQPFHLQNIREQLARKAEMFVGQHQKVGLDGLSSRSLINTLTLTYPSHNASTDH